tara:strand:- start:605 stop:1624 length:1020 start_codon:yes stop_codon:yes gene_type:complete
MEIKDFQFSVPKHLIAQNPLEERDTSRLLHVQDTRLKDHQFTDLKNLLRENDLLILNNTRVVKARLLGRKTSGGRVEILFERSIDESTFIGQIKFSGKLRPGSELIVGNNEDLEVLERQGHFFLLRSDKPIMEILDNSGSVPLPPYIKRDSMPVDEKRYQTIFASESGAVAAPTAGLHFTDSLLEEISSNGIDIGYLTLHVGAGTFMPLREEQLETKKLHKEQFMIDQILCKKIDKAKSNQGRIIAVGTTVVRALESIAQEGRIEAFQGETDIFITPGFEFKVIDAMVTNFHLPESSLIMLVSAFAGTQTILKSYQHAINSDYRFYSYGDAMFLEKQRQ